MKKKIIGLFIGFLSAFLGGGVEEVFAVGITLSTGGGGVTITENANSNTTAKIINDLVLTGDFGTDQLVEIFINEDSAVALDFKDTGVSLEDSGTTTSSLTVSSSGINFLASGIGTITVKQIGVFVVGSELVTDTDKLKITLDGVDYFGDDFDVNTAPIMIVVSAGDGGPVYTDSVDGASASVLNDLVLEGNFKVDELVEISFRGDSVAEMNFRESGVSIQNTGTSTSNLTYSTTKISFLASGEGTMTLSGIAVFIVNENGANDTEKLKITLDNVNYFADDFSINTNPVLIEEGVLGGGGVTVPPEAVDVGTAVTLEDLVLPGHFKTDEWVEIAFAENATSELNFKDSGVSLLDSGTASTNLTYAADNKKISFQVSGSGTITVSGIAVYIVNTDGSAEIENLKITLFESDVMGDGFRINGPPVVIPETGSGAGGGITVPVEAIDPLTSVELNTLQLTGDFRPNEDIVITFAGLSVAELNFKQYDISIQNDGTDTNDLDITADSISFRATGIGTITVSGIGIFIVNENDALDREKLKTTIDGYDYFGEYFTIIDLPDYPDGSGSFTGATGTNGIFRIGDLLTYIAPTLNNEEIFTIDFSPLGLSGEANAETGYLSTEGAVDDDSLSFTVTVSDNVGNSKTFQSSAISVDNIRPEVSLDEINFLTLPEGDEVGNIDDTLAFVPPIEDDEGNPLYFSANFTDISNENYINQLAAEKSIVLIDGLVDTEEYTKTIYLTDDAGNYPVGLPSVETNLVSIDVQRPVLSTTDLLTVMGAETPAVVGSIVFLSMPSDTSGDAITLSADLSALGGAEAVYEDVTEIQELTVVNGALNDEAYFVTITVTDEVGNTISANTNSIQVDNAPPTFDLACGATFSVIDEGESNEIADFLNFDSDSVNFTEPDGSLPGCDFETYTIDLSDISGDEAHNYEEILADGSVINIPVVSGPLDSETHTFVLKAYDVNGNESVFSSGELNIDNDVFDPEQTVFDIDFPEPTTAAGEYFYGVWIPVSITTVEVDLTEVFVQIPDTADLISLENNGNKWEGTLLIRLGELIRQNRNIEFRVIDDAGNVVLYTYPRELFITNIHVNMEQGDGGVPNLHRGGVRQLERYSVHGQNEIAIKKLKGRLKKLMKDPPEGIKRKRKMDERDTGVIPGKSYFDIFKEKLLLERKRVNKQNRKNKTGKQLENKFKTIMSRQIKYDNWEKIEDTQGGFRMQNTLESFKKRFTKKESKKKFHFSLRKTEVKKGGRYGKIRFDD